MSHQRLNNLKIEVARALLSSHRIRRYVNRLCRESLYVEPDSTPAEKVRNWQTFEPRKTQRQPNVEIWAEICPRYGI